ncbi:tRNA1(Val) (adenine(37)-N6)-methyltransferase [Saccharicrinis sp. FJH54]|uniref:tRNA1(Val) (adenine(37)-N6)-methyltransferase n=1 Tax=Saccharicrinis sp. FJH54 TaxID=3344665 RepID=UPI0035D40A43
MPGKFRFKQFEIDQEGAAQKVGTDSVLLGAWVNHSLCKTILDIGCGTGVLALMMAQRFPHAMIDAVEIDDAACRCAVKNVENSMFKYRITVWHQKIQTFSTPVQYDLIISNPPFFSSGLQSPAHQRSAARHTDHLTHDELLHSAERLLKDSGSFALILPEQEANGIGLKAIRFGLFRTRTCHVHPLPGKEPNRVMITFQKDAADKLSVEHIVVRNADRTYSEAYKILTKDFYLSL